MRHKSVIFYKLDGFKVWIPTHWEWTDGGITGRTETARGRPVAGDLWIGLHGLTGTGRDFEPFFESFSKPVLWEAPDLPGHGGFEPGALEAAYSMAGCASMLKARLDEASEPVILVGYSMGGRIALNFCSKLWTPSQGARLVRIPASRTALSGTSVLSGRPNFVSV